MGGIEPNAIVADGFCHGVDVGTQEVQCSDDQKVIGYADNSENRKNPQRPAFASACWHYWSPRSPFSPDRYDAPWLRPARTSENAVKMKFNFGEYPFQRLSGNSA